jgi:2-iminobutanoate/2-iminopropanoate deaminase
LDKVIQLVACLEGSLQINRIYTDKVAEPPAGLWSNCLRVNDQVFLSGMVALDKNDAVVGVGDSYQQANYIFECIRDYMEEAGGRMSDIVSLNIFVTDMEHRPGVLKARQKFFTGDFPCSTLVAVSALIKPELLVEINAVGFVGEGSSVR